MPGEAKPRRQPRTGPLLMVLASLAFVVTTSLIKLTRETLSGAEVVFWRGAVSTIILLPFLGHGRLQLRNPKLFALRLCLGYGALLGQAIAAKGLSLLDLNLATRLRPLLISMLAPLFFGKEERSGSPVWLALLVGLLGSMLLLLPELQAGSFHTLWILFSVICASASQLCLRGLGESDNSLTLVFWFHFATALVACGQLFLFEGGLRVPARPLWGILVGMGLSATLSQLLMTQAYSIERAPLVAAASYTGPLWALLGDLIIFRETPTPLALLGGALLFGSSLWLILGGPIEKQAQSRRQRLRRTL
jgi:drug/metabolite transporter (DMT)-like permease